MGIKLAIMLILVVPALFWGLKFTLIGAYFGLVKREVPIGETPAKGWFAVVIGVYSLILAMGIVFASVYLSLWLFP